MSKLVLSERPFDHEPFYVIISNFNTKEFDSYDVMPYFMREYETLKKSKRLQGIYGMPETDAEWQKFVKDKSRYMFWARCEYEIVLGHWPPRDVGVKIDIHDQVLMNLPIIAEILKRNVTSK